MENQNAIRILGSSNPNVPAPKPSIVKLFNVVAEMYMLVPFDFYLDVVRFLKEKDYVYKTKMTTRYHVIAVQYQKAR